jgi:hypothetical protein
MTAEGNEKVVHAKPGEYAEPGVGNSVVVYPLEAADPDEQNIITDIKGTFHVHPSGDKLMYENGQPIGLLIFQQPPSSGIQNSSGQSTGDVENATFNGLNPSGYNIVAGARSEKIYIYGTSSQNQSGKTYRAEFPLDKFRNIGNEIENP